MTDLDKSGYGYQRVRTYLGPSLGWTDEYVQPATNIVTGGIHLIGPGESLILVDVAGPVQLNLPDVVKWIQQPANQPATGFERSITIKDLGGNAANFNIVVVPFGQQAIDNVQQSILISQARAAIKLVPLIDMSGWAVALASVSGGGSGGGDVFKAGNNTYTGTNTFNGPITVPTAVAGDNSQNAASTAFVKNQNYIDGNALLPYALIASPTFTGDPKSNATLAPGDNDTSLATTAFVQSAIAASGGGAPTNAEYITSSANATLTAERVLTNTASITWDFSTAGQAKANTAAGGGNVSNSGTPTVGQYAKWVTSTTIQGVLANTVLTDIGGQPLDAELSALAGLPSSADTMPYFTGAGTAALTNLTPAARTVLAGTTVGAMLGTLGGQPLDGDLTAISALGGTNTIYYRSAVDIWSPVTFSGLSFSGGVLTVTAGGGNVNNSGTPAITQYARWTDATHIEGRTPAQVLTDIGAAPAGSEYITSTVDATLTGERVLTDTPTVTWDRATAGQIKANAAGGGVSAPQGRLTLSAANPVQVTSIPGGTTLYYLAYVGNYVPIFNGTSFVMTAFNGLLSTPLNDTTKNPAAVGASQVHDWFVWNDAGTIRLGHGPAWTSDTTRSAGTALVKPAGSGFLVNQVAITNGPGINRGTYVGTTRSNGASQLDWIFGAVGTPVNASVFHVWNMYNRTRVTAFNGLSTGSYTYDLAIPRPMGGDTNYGHFFVVGQAEDGLTATSNQMSARSGTDAPQIGIGFDSTTTFSTTVGGSMVFGGAPSAQGTSAYFTNIPPIGRHFVMAMESAGSNPPTFYGASGAGGYGTGFSFDYWM